MNVDQLLVRLLIDGYVVVPNVLNADEVKEAQAAFECKAGEHETHNLSWAQLRSEEAMVHATCHPKIMAVVDAFVSYFDQEAVLCCHNGARDAGGRDAHDEVEAARMPGFGSEDRRKRAGWHNDGRVLKDVRDAFSATSLTALLYFDQTFANNGAFVVARGSHHLHFSFGTKGEQPYYPDNDFLLDNCELRPVPVEAGSAIIFRAQSWHGVLPTHLKHRRLMVQCFCAKDLFYEMHGHNVFANEADFLPAEKHRYLYGEEDGWENQKAGARQDILYIQAASSSLSSGALGISMVVDGKRQEISANPEEWPYRSALDAINDGWRVVQFPDLSLLMDELNPKGLGCEFILERWRQL
ncbi:MAG: phytanoyl-CoA dioxygenase family protein [Planctomycetota bacterium]|jgi:ectoine hydroxylase-related dioxygenase (phytanoyl-CoA dioxygenase family)|nr:phytanoyl-CoA dioxygenase family protein [Planctomycetota bacterium]MDP7132971.1 phytanoyl-CoA dioxygenase family protein [Planctomycetota bacterium]MDP7249040.1 phytanoyl-CoA dioxygenase family protein [Planctomycetota bacterium]